MKKRLEFVCVLLILLFILGAVISDENRMIQFIVESSENFYISLKVDDRMQEVLPWYDEAENLYYFFLPSCVQGKAIYFDSEPDCRVVLNGIEISKRNSFQWKKGEIYSLELDDNSFCVTFMKSENLPSLFMDTESGSMEAIWEDKDYKESGTLTVVSQNGNVQYHGKLDKISGRGNSTWASPKKKPYSVSLAESYPLCNLDTNKNWKLLAMWFEYDKMHTKIILDLAREIGLYTTPECTWVDLYCEGEYQGLYLLTEAVDSDYRDIEGVLLEREIDRRLKQDENFFITELCHYIFTFKRPSIISEEQMRETVDFVQSVEDMIVAGDGTYKEYIDMDSIAKQYLLDKIFMEVDAMDMSTFYYIDLEKEKIYAGPFWDYDRSLGLHLMNYNAPIDDAPNKMYAWYNTFYNDWEFYQVMYTNYIELLPKFERILQEDIDCYVEWIQTSVEMDNILYGQYIYLTEPQNANFYQYWDSYVRYMKFFLANRLNYLSDLWGVAASGFEVPASTGEYHDVYFKMLDDTIVEKRSVLDGTCMDELPASDTDLYSEWYYWHVQGAYSTLRPVYEDLILYAKPIIEEVSMD